jgi:cyanophycinase-like exopeptidase
MSIRFASFCVAGDYTPIDLMLHSQGEVGMPLGNVVFFGSGETSPTGGLIFQRLAGGVGKAFRISILETPAGFEPNSALVAARVADFLRSKLGEKTPRIRVIPARRKGTAQSPDSPEILEPLAIADWIYFGAGSPSYTVRQLENSLAWRQILAAWQQGATLILASAAMIAAGAHALPVYEIYKVGEDPHWIPGLDLFGTLGWKLILISHWNNAEGGEELDTSRCFIGRERFQLLLEQLPAGAVVLGLDEHTSVSFDWERGVGQVEGKGTVTLLAGGREIVHPAGEKFPLREIGEYSLPPKPFGVEEDLWQDVQRRRASRDAEAEPPQEVQSLIQERERIRKAGNFAEADVLRGKIEQTGWIVMDTPQGPVAKPGSAG